jgi:hypothetical protein
MTMPAIRLLIWASRWSPRVSGWVRFHFAMCRATAVPRRLLRRGWISDQAIGNASLVAIAWPAIFIRQCACRVGAAPR